MATSAVRIVLPYFTSLLLLRGCSGRLARYQTSPMDMQRWALPRLRAEMVRLPGAGRAAPEFPLRDRWEYGCCHRTFCPCGGATSLPNRGTYPCRARRHIAGEEL